jgi:ribonuclease P protein component
MRLSRHRRLTRSADFRRVREKGSSQGGRLLVLGVLRDESVPDLKAGFITTKRLGNAVIRNLVRRRMRTVVTELGDLLLPGYLLVTVARPAAAQATREALLKEWKWLARKAGLLRPLE